MSERQDERYELLCEQLGQATNAELEAELRALTRELARRLENYGEACRGGDEESRAAADEGLVLAARTTRVLEWAKRAAFRVQCDLERFGWERADSA